MAQKQSAWDSPRPAIRPPVLYAGAFLAGIALEFLWPTDLRHWINEVYLLFPGIALTGAGAAALLAALRQFERAGTNVHPGLPANVLVTDGIYSYSRNPIYVAVAVIYTGTALVFACGLCLAALPVVLLILNFGVIRREEAYLARKFGDAYADYKSEVRRWI